MQVHDQRMGLCLGINCIHPFFVQGSIRWPHKIPALYALSFLLISLGFEISKTLLTTWRKRTRQGDLYLLDYVDCISPVFKLDHWNIYMYVCVCVYIYIHTYLCFFIYISLHVHSIASGCIAQWCQLQCVTLNQIYPKWSPPVHKNNRAYAWSARGSESLRSTDGNKYSCKVM